MLIRRFVRRMAVAIGGLGCIMAIAIGTTWAVEGVGSIEFGLEAWVAIEAYLAVAATICYTSWHKEMSGTQKETLQERRTREA